jgi:hypothetical protein
MRASTPDKVFANIPENHRDQSKEVYSPPARLAMAVSGKGRAAPVLDTLNFQPISAFWADRKNDKPNRVCSGDDTLTRACPVGRADEWKMVRGRLADREGADNRIRVVREYWTTGTATEQTHKRECVGIAEYTSGRAFESRDIRGVVLLE